MELLEGPMSRASIGLYEFGPFRLDLERRLFAREHQVVPLAFDSLPVATGDAEVREIQ